MDFKKYFVSPNINEAETLPAEAFTSVEFMKMETDLIFKKHWLWLPVDPPHSPNSLSPVEMLGSKIFLSEDEKGILRAFPNACTHKWNELVPVTARASKIICKYHGRQFGLDGKFILQPRCEGLLNFPRECDNLREINICERFGFFFLNFAGNAPDIDKILAPLAMQFTALPIASMKRVPVRFSTIINGNWKYHIDNYVDELHLKYVHGADGGLCDQTEIGSYETKLFDHSTVRWVYAKNEKEGFIHPSFPKPVFGIWWHIFPNLTINIWRGGISLNSYLPDFSDPGKTVLSVEHFAWDKAEFNGTRKKWVNMHVDIEDLSVVGGVQKVISGTSVPRGRFTPNGEQACHWFQRKIYESIAY